MIRSLPETAASGGLFGGLPDRLLLAGQQPLPYPMIVAQADAGCAEARRPGPDARPHRQLCGCRRARDDADREARRVQGLVPALPARRLAYALARTPFARLVPVLIALAERLRRYRRGEQVPPPAAPARATRSFLRRPCMVKGVGRPMAVALRPTTEVRTASQWQNRPATFPPASRRSSRGRRASGIIGLGYVGIPLALAAVKAGFRVIGFDIDAPRVAQLNRGESFIKHIETSAITQAVQTGRFEATTDFSRAGEADAILIAVPTPLTKYREPDLSYIVRTAESIAPHMRKGHSSCSNRRPIPARRPR